jgi:preprotein translocase subunit YajC
MPDNAAGGKVSGNACESRAPSGKALQKALHQRPIGRVRRPAHNIAGPSGPQERMPMFVSPAFAQAAAGQPSAGAAFAQFLPIILIFVIFYFLLIRPQQKRMKEHRAMVDALRRGDEVITSGGIVGKVSKVQDDGKIEVEIAEGVKVKVIKHTITQVLNKTEPAAN